jgi:hypothetical protein
MLQNDSKTPFSVPRVSLEEKMMIVIAMQLISSRCPITTFILVTRKFDGF